MPSASRIADSFSPSRVCDGGFPLARRSEHDRAAGALGLHLLVHGVHHVRRRIDSLQLDPLHAYAPAVGRVVEDLAEVAVDLISGGERLVELEIADEVAQVRLGELRHCEHEVRDVVDETLRVGRLVVDDGVDRHDDVVLGDDLLRRHVDDLLAHVDEPQVLDRAG